MLVSGGWTDVCSFQWQPSSSSSPGSGCRELESSATPGHLGHQSCALLNSDPWMQFPGCGLLWIHISSGVCTILCALPGPESLQHDLQTYYSASVSALFSCLKSRPSPGNVRYSGPTSSLPFHSSVLAIRSAVVPTLHVTATLSFLQCHVSSVPVYVGLKRRSLRAYLPLVAVALAICLVVYSLTGVFGFLSYYKYLCISSDILQNYCPRDPPVDVARVMLILVMITSYPILAFCARYI